MQVTCSTSRYESGRKLPLGSYEELSWLKEGGGKLEGLNGQGAQLPCSLLPQRDPRILITMICFLDSETLASGISVFLPPTLLTFLGTSACHRSQGFAETKSNSSSPQKFAVYVMQRKVSECRHRRKKKVEKETTQHWKLVCATVLNDYPGPLGEAGIIPF